MSPIEDAEYMMESADLRALVESGMTKEVLETIASQVGVQIKMTKAEDIDEVIKALSALT